ncbi:MAG: flippase [bacterium]|nr:flippase [bacterium]
MRQIGRNIFSLGISRVVSGIIIFVVYIKLVTYLGPTEFGKFALVLTYYTIFLLLVDLGISKYAIKKISEDRSRALHYLSNFFIAQFLVSTAVLLCFFVISEIANYESDVRAAMLLAGIGLFFGSLSNPFGAIVQAWQKLHVLAAVNFINTIINAAWLLFAIYTGKSFVFTFWVYSIIGILGFVIYAAAASRLTPLGGAWDRKLLNRNLVSNMLIYGLPFAFISGFEILIAKADSIIQKFFLPYSDVGLYAGAYRFIDALTFIPAVIAISLFPFIAEKTDLQDQEVKNTFNHWNRYLLALAIPLGVGASLLADKIVLTLFDERYTGSILPFQILIWAAVATFVYAVPNVIMIVKKTKATVWVLSAVAVFNIIANLFFVPRYGIAASAWLTVLSYVLVGAFYLVISKKLSSYRLLSFGVYPLLASVPMGLVVWQLRSINLFLAIGIGAAVYLAVLIATGFLKKEDWIFVRSLL